MKIRDKVIENLALRLFLFRWAEDGWWRNQSEDRQNLCRSYAKQILSIPELAIVDRNAKPPDGVKEADWVQEIKDETTN